MTLSSPQIVDVVELVAYAPILPLILYLTWRHGRHGILGYLYLNVACTIRVVYDIVSLTTQVKSTELPSMGTIILGSIGLTPLLLALAGFTHEAHLALLSTQGRVMKTTRRWLWFAQAQIHIVASIGIVLLIIGNVELVSSSNSQTDVQTDDHLRSAGAVILLIVCGALIQYSIWLLHQWPSTPSATAGGRKEMAKFNLLAALMIVAKVAYTVAYTFNPSNRSLNPITGSLAIKVVFNFLIPLGAICAMATGGWKSRGYQDGMSIRRTESGDSTEYESLRSKDVHMTATSL